MTDLEKFKSLYESLGIPVKVGIEDDGDKYISFQGYAKETTFSTKFSGTSSTIIYFTADGKFIEQCFFD